MPLIGWRPLFWALAVLMALSMVADRVARAALARTAGRAPATGSRPAMRGVAPSLFPADGAAGLLQLRRHDRRPVACGPGRGWCAWPGYAPLRPPRGLFTINLRMLAHLLGLGHAQPLAAAPRHRHRPPDRLGPAAEPAGAGGIIAAGPAAGAVDAGAVLRRAAPSCRSRSRRSAWCSRRRSRAGRLSAYNLVIFVGVFVVQWGIGLLIDALRAAGPAKSTRSVAAHRPCSWRCSLASYALLPAGRTAIIGRTAP